MTRNQQGLTRSISAEVKRAIRQRCGFGCVACGFPIIQYHHFNPPFTEATTHDPDGITLLCGTCHDKVGRGIIHPERVVAANSSPKCLQTGHTKDILTIGDSLIPVRFGSSRVRAASVLMYDDRLVFGFLHPEVPGSPLRLNATLTDPHGKVLLQIVDNEWQVGVDRYDIHITADRLKINEARRDIILEMSLAVNREIQITRLKMHFRGFNIVADPKSFSLQFPFGTFRHNGENVADVGIWMKSTGQALIAASADGGAAISLG